MLLAAVLLAHASAEWVEISQQHYRKPLRTYNFNTKTYLEDTTKPWHNHSLTEYNWNKDITHDETTRDYDKNPLQNEPERYHYGSAMATEDGALKGTVERVPNVGNVRRVQLNNSPVKSPNIKHKSEDDTEKAGHQEIIPKHSYGYRVPINNIKFPHTTARIPFLTKEKDEMVVTDGPVENKHEFYNITAINSPDHVFDTKNFMDIKNEGSPENYKHNRKTGNNSAVNSNEKNNQIKHQEDKHPITDNANRSFIKRNPDTNGESKTKDLHREPDQLDIREGLNKADTIANLMKFMIVVTDTISKNSRRTFNGKMRYLQELKNNILGNIEDRIDATWPDDSDAGGSARRRSRSARAQPESRGHVQFPSSESTLMTISFLTFAVFLIKLVLQVIQTYKNKTMMVAPLVVAAAGRAAYAHHKHN